MANSASLLVSVSATGSNCLKDQIPLILRSMRHVVSVSATGSNCLKASGEFFWLAILRVSVSATGSNCLKEYRVAASCHWFCMFQYPQPDRIVWRERHVNKIGRFVWFQYPQPDRIVWRTNNFVMQVSLEKFQYPQPDRIVWRIWRFAVFGSSNVVSVSATGSNCLKVSHFAYDNTFSAFQYPQPDRIVWRWCKHRRDNRLRCFSIRNRIELFEGRLTSSQSFRFSWFQYPQPDRIVWRPKIHFRQTT